MIFIFCFFPTRLRWSMLYTSGWVLQTVYGLTGSSITMITALLFVGNRVIGYELSQQLLIPPSSPGSHQDKFDLKPNNRHSKAMIPFSIS